MPWGHWGPDVAGRPAEAQAKPERKYTLLGLYLDLPKPTFL